MTPEQWLRARVAGAPEQLVSAMVAALPRTAGSVPEALAAGALELYSRVARGTGGRADAEPLLAADALFTHAFQAQAEISPEDLTGFASRLTTRLAEVAT